MKVVFLLLVVLLCFAGAQNPILLSASYTPFRVNGDINFDVIDAQIAMHKKAGVTHVWVTGGMAQWDQITVAERIRLADAYIKACKKYNLYSIIHVGHQCIKDAQELAARVEALGPDAISIIPPSAPEKPDSLDVLVNVIAQIASAAPNTPFYYYHIPSVTNINYDMKDLITKSKNIIPTLSGIKYVADNLPDFKACTEMTCDYKKGCPNGKFNVMWANNPKIQALPYGATAFVLAENYYAPYMKAVFDAWATNRTRSQELQDHYNTVMECVKNGKSVMRMLGLDLGPPRLPQLSADPQAYIQSCDCLRNVGFFQQHSVQNPNCVAE